MIKPLLSIFIAGSLLGLTTTALAGEGKRQEHKGHPPFSEFDLDGDARVTLEEFKKHRIPHGNHETVFGHIDANGDGVIEEEELKNHKPPRRHRQRHQEQEDN